MSLLIASLIALFIAFIIFLDHYRTHGYFIDIKDVDNHETIAIFFIGISLGLLIAHFLT